jgi:lipoprotein NlpD
MAAHRRRLDMSLCKRLTTLTILLLFLFACAGPSIRKSEKPHGVYHEVKKGETLWSISRAYHADLQDIAEINNITNPAAIAEGIVIFVPGADHVIETTSHAELPTPPKEQTKSAIKKPAPRVTEAKKPIQALPVPPVSKAATPEKPPPQRQGAPVEKPYLHKQETPPYKPSSQKPDAPVEPKIEFDRNRFIWPLKGIVTSKFGIQPNGLKNNGIKISAGEGTSVMAAAAGEVAYASRVKYYGETIIIKHDGHYSTVYTCLKDMKVNVGNHVKKGERIALLGLPENGDGQPNLNFEIRLDNKPRNPLFFLP